MSGRSGTVSPPRIISDPFMAFQFTVQVGHANGTQVAGGFSDVTGLNVETEVETLRVGGLNDAEVMLAGPTKYSSRLVLKRGLADSVVLWHWYLTILGGSVTREDVTIHVRSADGKKKASWTFIDACPVKWTGPELHAGTSAVAFEAIDLVHRGLLLPPRF